MIYAGIDEAGLGPPLGPLVTSMSAFQCSPALTDLWETAGLFSEAGRDGIGDSKKIYSPRKGLKGLELPVSCFLRTCGFMAEPFLSTVIENLTGRGYNQVFENSFWFAGEDLQLPLAGELKNGIEADQLAQAGIERVYAAARVVNAPAFNASVRQGLNKSELLFVEICSLLQGLFQAFPGADMSIVIDRLGGRKYYYRYLLENFPDWRIAKVWETDKESVYNLQQDGATVILAFRVKADRSDLCAALASMVAKYIRELSMHMFNSFFQSLCPGIAPTAGYPTDARRFLTDIAACINDADRDRLVRSR